MVLSFGYYEVRISAPTGAKLATVMGLAITQPLLRAKNLKTARALGLSIPQSVLLRADEVIQ